MPQNIFQCRSRTRRRQRHYSLVIFRIGQPVDLSPVLEPHRNALLARQLHDLFDSRVLPPPRNRNTIDRTPRLQRFLYHMYASQLIHGEESLPFDSQ